MPPPDGNQSYFWGSGVSQPQNMGYYSVPPPSFPPPNFRQPPPSYNLPVSTLTENKATNFAPSYHSMTNCYQSEVPNSYPNVSYQNQTETQCNNQNFGLSDYSQPVTGNFNTNWDDRNVYQNNGSTEWNSNNYTSDWNKYQNDRNSWYELNKVQEDDRKSVCDKYNESSNSRGSEWRYRGKESSNSRTMNRKRSRSPESRSRTSRSPHRSRYDSQRDRSKYHRNSSSSRERSHNEENVDRRSSYRRNNSYVSRSQKSYISHRSRKKSRSQESYSSRASSPNNSSSSKRDPTERELLLEKYR